MSQQEAAEEIIRTVELLMLGESDDNCELDIYDSEYNILIRYGDLTEAKTAIIIESKIGNMRLECISGEIVIAEEISEADVLYWERKAQSLRETTVDEYF